MATPLTWRNIGSPNRSAGNALFSQGIANATQNTFEGLHKIAAGKQAADEIIRKREQEARLGNFVASIQGASKPEDLQGLDLSGLGDQTLAAAELISNRRNSMFDNANTDATTTGQKNINNSFKRTLDSALGLEGANTRKANAEVASTEQDSEQRKILFDVERPYLESNAKNQYRKGLANTTIAESDALFRPKLNQGQVDANEEGILASKDNRQFQKDSLAQRRVEAQQKMQIAALNRSNQRTLAGLRARAGGGSSTAKGGNDLAERAASYIHVGMQAGKTPAQIVEESSNLRPEAQAAILSIYKKQKLAGNNVFTKPTSTGGLSEGQKELGKQVGMSAWLKDPDTRPLAKRNMNSFIKDTIAKGEYVGHDGKTFPVKTKAQIKAFTETAGASATRVDSGEHILFPWLFNSFGDDVTTKADFNNGGSKFRKFLTEDLTNSGYGSTK